jgi:hypothetical protein
MNNLKTYFHFVFGICLVLTFTSCRKTIYQVLETSSDDVKMQNSQLVFEDAALKLTYDFWSNSGQVKFLLYNKTDKPLFIDWDKSHLVYNGISYEYWTDSEKTNSFLKTNSSSVTSIVGKTMSVVSNSKTTFGETTKTKPKKVVHIPAKSSLEVNNFSIQGTAYFNCDFKIKAPLLKNMVTKTFDKTTSPTVFRNYITYSDNVQLDNIKTIDNEFYVSSVKNIRKKYFFGKRERLKICTIENKTKRINIYPFPYKQANSFYIRVH